MATPIGTISKQTRRRFILGKQGLWPGRRWSGKGGLGQALKEIEAVQIDPVLIVAPSADIVLWGRVAEYDEVIFLSPLEYVSARGRAGKLFDFAYIWEIYKPAEKRQYGPYTLPISYGDRLVGCMDAKLEREQQEVRSNGLWFEDWFSVDENFVVALAKGFDKFMRFLGAASFDLDAVKPSALRQEIRCRMNH